MTVTSTTEAEFLAISTATKLIITLRMLCKEICYSLNLPTKILSDNQGAVKTANNDLGGQRTRHLGAHVAFVKENCQNQVVEVSYIPGELERADILTKALPAPKFQRDRSLIMTSLCLIVVVQLLASTVEGREINVTLKTKPKSKFEIYRIRNNTINDIKNKLHSLIDELNNKRTQTNIISTTPRPNIEVVTHNKKVADLRCDEIQRDESGTYYRVYYTNVTLNDGNLKTVAHVHKIWKDQLKFFGLDNSNNRTKRSSTINDQKTLVKDDSEIRNTTKEASLSPRNFTLDVIQSIYWSETDIKRAKGELSVNFNIPHIDHCEELHSQIMKYANYSLEHEVFRAASHYCYKNSMEFENSIDKFKNISISNSRVIRQTNMNDTSDDIITREERKAISPAAFWSSLLSTPFGQNIMEYQSEESAYNTVWQHEKEIFALQKQIKNHKQQFSKMQTANDDVITTLRSLTTTTKELRDNVEVLGRLIPEVNYHLASSLDNLKKEATLFDQLRNYILKNRFQTYLLSGRIENPVIQNIDPELTNIKSVQVSSNRDILIKFTAIEIDYNTTILKTVSFKKWLDHDIFEETHEELFSMYQKEYNCSKIISKPLSHTVTDTCDMRNMSIPSDLPLHWRRRNANPDENTDIVHRDQDYLIIQCYRHEFTLGNATYPCPMEPFIVVDFWRHLLVPVNW